MEHTKQKSTKRRAQQIAFELFINGRSYSVNASPFTIATGDTMYRVSYNNGPVHVFAWDDGLNRYAESDAQAEVIPPVIEMAIAGKLNECISQQMQHAA